jgi:thiamine pyrophosphokinase
VDYNDLQKALKYCIVNRYKSVAILGATGLRDDHFLSNIGILMHYATKISLTMVTNYGIFTPIHQTTTFESYHGQQVSVFNFSQEAIITYHGLKYPVYRQNFKELWEGSLNESFANSFTIELEKNVAVLVYLAF